ncbi:MAG TPA: iron-containing alcohol dehydrogenase [Candidatus Izemoplasmatales bacterium]|nr:iron-containing alcohol dehydrogenase [Candidatus Izemoplasmatales bacterium]
MNDFTFFSPTEFVFGKNAENQVGTLLRKYGARKVLIHYGGGSIVKTGLLDKVEAILHQEGLAFVTLGGVQPNPRDTLVYRGIELCKNQQIDFILAIGGGSVIDSAKAIAAGARYDGDFWDFFEEKVPILSALRIGVILTIPAAGSEGSHRSVITKEQGMLKRGAGNQHVRPAFSIINPELTFTLPAYQTAAGIVDMMAHILERYLTKTSHVELTDRLCEATLVSIIEAARVLMKNPLDYDARATICWSGTIAHNGSLGVGRTEDWATHLLEHELSGLYDVTHGAGLAVMFPAYMRYALDVDVERFRRLAIRVWDVPDRPEDPRGVALTGIQAMEDFFRFIGMPVSFSEIGAREADIDLLTEKLFAGRKSATFGPFCPLTREGAKAVYRLACR